MANQGKVGQPAKNYVTSAKKTIVGLTKQPDGRWRIQATGQRFTEPDEGVAVAKALAIIDGLNPESVHKVPIETKGVQAELKLNARFWQGMRKILLTDPQLCADKCGIPQLANLSKWSIPIEATKLKDVWAAFTKYRKSKDGKLLTKTKAAWDDFVAFFDAATVEDFPKSQLVEYRELIKANPKYSPKTQGLIFSRIKTVVNTAAKNAVAVEPLRTDLIILNAPAGQLSLDSSPIHKATFKHLLDNADDKMRAMLLIGLNCCMYLKEVVEVRWKEIDLEAGTLVARRNKTGIIRAATLWPETILAIKAVSNTSEFVTRSSQGGQYYVEAARKLYGAYRDKLKIARASDNDFSAIRDGAFTQAARNVLLQQAQALAGHKCGQSDHYIKKNPEYVKPACDAVYNHYMK